MRVVAVFMVWLSAVALAAASDEVLSKDKATLATHLLAGLRKNRERLESGVFASIGTKRDVSPAGSANGEVQLYVAFDFPSRRQRFDRFEPRLIQWADKPVPTVEVRGGRFARTPTTTVRWTKGERAASTTSNAQPLPQAEIDPFDVRTIGLLPLINIHKEDDLTSAMQMYLRESPTALTEEAKGVYGIEWRSPIKGGFWDLVMRLCIDENRGYSPVKGEWFLAKSGSPEDTEYYQHCVSQASWQVIDGTWVPHSWHIRDRMPNNSLEKEYNLTFAWESVNRPVAERLFTAAGFELPTGSLHVNKELGRTVITEVVGGAQSPLRDIPQMSTEQVRQRRWWNEHWLYSCIAAAALALVVWQLVRNRRKRAIV